MGNVTDSWLPHFRMNTFIASISRHLESENINGKLSMWRAYGRNTGVAIVMNVTPFTLPSDAYGAYSAPVQYKNFNTFNMVAIKIFTLLMDNKTRILSIDREIVKQAIIYFLRISIFCTKHVGVEEEREWRIFYTPGFDPDGAVVKSLELIGDVPQIVYKLPLEGVKMTDDYTVTLDRLLSHIIIGPCSYPFVIDEALENVLGECGVTKPKTRIAISEITLRT